MGTRANINKSTEITLLNAAASISFPSGSTDGADISVDSGGIAGAGQWKQFGAGDVDAAIFLVSSQAMSLSAGIGLYGYRADKTKWYLLGSLNNGSAITTLGASTGFSCVVEFAGVFDRLAIGSLTAAAVTPSAGTVTVTACQIRMNFDRRS